jgi:hypothetical protein
MDLIRKIERIEADIAELKKIIQQKPKQKSKQKKSIDDVQKKSELTKFTVKELKEWIKENGISTKKLADKYKEELVKLVWKNLRKAHIDESENDSDSGSDSSLDDLD